MLQQIIRAMGETVDDQMAKVIADRYAVWQKKAKERRKRFALLASSGRPR